MVRYYDLPSFDHGELPYPETGNPHSRKRVGRSILLFTGFSLFMAAAAVFPVHQAAQYRELEWEQTKIVQQLSAVIEENRVLAAEGAELANPDRITRIAEHVLSLKKAGSEDVAIVISAAAHRAGEQDDR